MRTVKEMSALTGISVRTLHYYDEIGLLHPTVKSEAGYRLYDDKALETLQQILFFREFDIPLKEIKAIMDTPSLDRNQILQMQRRMLTAKKERLARLIAGIDGILRGENDMDFEIFNKTEIEELCNSTIEHMPDVVRQSIIQEFGSIEEWKKHYIAIASGEDMQKGYQKMVQWYGGKDSALDKMKNPPGGEIGSAFAERIKAIEKKLSEKRAEPVNSFEVRQIIGEYGFVMKRFYQVSDEKPVMLAAASCYRDECGKAAADMAYGEGSAEFFADAIESFYAKK